MQRNRKWRPHGAGPTKRTATSLPTALGGLRPQLKQAPFIGGRGRSPERGTSPRRRLCRDRSLAASGLCPRATISHGEVRKRVTGREVQPGEDSR